MQSVLRKDSQTQGEIVNGMLNNCNEWWTGNVQQQECWYFGGFWADVTDGLSHGSRRLWIGVATEILGLEQEGNTEMTAMEDEDNTLRMTQELSNKVCKLHNVWIETWVQQCRNETGHWSELVLVLINAAWWVTEWLAGAGD